MKTSTILFVILFAGIMPLKAQNILTSNLQWNVTTATNQADLVPFTHVCSFTSNGTSTLDWSQNSDQMIMHYTVTSVDGTWADVSSDGQAVYHVQNDIISGTITFA